MPTNDPKPTKAVRRDEARAKAAQMRKEQERKAKRNRILAISGLVVAVVALVAVAFTIVNQNQANQAANSDVVYGQGTDGVVRARAGRRRGARPGRRDRRHPGQRDHRRGRRCGR